MKKIAKILFLLIFTILVAAIGGGIYAYNWYQTGIKTVASDSGDKVLFEVKQGESAPDLGPRLKSQGLIKDENIYSLYLKLEKKGGDIKAGKFLIPKNLTVVEVVDTLSKTQNLTVFRVTLVEGWSAEKMATKLANEFQGREGVRFKKDEFLSIVNKPDSIAFSEGIAQFLKTYKPTGKSLEGFLYPNTYEFNFDDSSQDVAETFLTEFIKETRDLQKDPTKFYKQLTLASIIERESYTNDERDEIASVFQNRLNKGMLLQSDATINYATKTDNARPTYQDLQIDSPYNTYKYTGLPPTPINNPRLESIKAAITPAKTDYYYFIHEQNSSHLVHFAKTLAEHNQNVSKYLD
jgi:UPF0755 protein